MSTNKRIDSTIIAALIGVMGTVCVTLITLYLNYFGPGSQPQPTAVVQPTWTAPAISTIANTPVPTDTVPVGDPTSTAVPDTPTPEPTLTPVPPAIGADWVNGCISVLWRPFPNTVPTTANNGCLAQPINLSEPVNLFFTDISSADGVATRSLKFQVNRSFDSPQVYGLFAPIPSNGIVRIDTFLRRIQGGAIWMGVFAEPNLTSQGLVASLPEGENVRNRPLVQMKMPEQVEVQRMESFPDDPTQDPPRYSIVFELSNGEVRIQKLGETEFSPVALNSPQAWLFVGYQVNGNTRIEAEFLNLLVQAQ
jgi:hypothetical protein